MICLTLLDGVLVYLSLGIFWLFYSWPMIMRDAKALKEEDANHVKICIVLYGFWLVLTWWAYLAQSAQITRRLCLKD